MGKVILVTGANRGIGLAIVQQLAQHSQLQQSTILMGCRDIHKAEPALKELGGKGISNVKPVQIDVSSDLSIRNAVRHIADTYQSLDVLVNNAGFAAIPRAADFSDLRQTFQDIYNINVTSVALTTSLFLPMLRTSEGKVIQVSSARASIARSAAGELPPTVSAGYSISKTALNALTVEMSRIEGNELVEFQLASPGHCKTEFNNYRGMRDPLEGANVVVELTIGPRRKIALYETKGESRELLEVPW